MTVSILTGDVFDVLPTLPDASAQMCVTSPPYWGLRDYGVAGQLGLERTPEEYVARMVAVFREVGRVLRDDGTLWLNLGDSYARSQETNVPQTKNRPVAFPHHAKAGSSDGAVGRADRPGTRSGVGGLKPKDLVGIPWRVAFALQADGWYLRSDIIWHKPNPMPESVTDRPTKAHEYLFLLAKSERYVYDADAIAEDVTAEPKICGPKNDASRNDGDRVGILRGNGFTRNRRSVWSVGTQPFREAHFATFPPKLIEPCILAGSARQACEHCGAAWERIVDRGPLVDQRQNPGKPSHLTPQGYLRDGKSRCGVNEYSETVGWQPRCTCEGAMGSGRSVVLDPFGGAGTTGLVADRLGRDAVLIELNPAYAEMARTRITDDAPLFADGAA